MSTTAKPRKRAKVQPPRSFPFAAGTGFKNSDMQKAEAALKVYTALWNAVQRGELSPSELKDVFFHSICDPITYRESWRCGKYWSKDAWERALSLGHTNKIGLVSEHLIPRGALLEESLARPLDQAQKLVWDLSIECMITKEEDALLSSNGLKSKAYFDNPFERYRIAGISILDIEHPKGHFFLNDHERDSLRALGILAPYSPAACSCVHCV